MNEKKRMNCEETWDYIENDYFKKESSKVDSLKSIYASWKQEFAELEKKHNRCKNELFFVAIDELNEQLAELEKSEEEKKLAETLHKINKAYMESLFAFADENGMDRKATAEIAYYLDSVFEWGD